MQARLPVLACTDPNTDIGKVITDGGFGRWCESNDTQDFKNLVTEFVKLGNEESTELKKNAFDYLADHFNTSSSAATIMKKISIPE
jgi:thiaminase